MTIRLVEMDDSNGADQRQPFGGVFHRCKPKRFNADEDTVSQSANYQPPAQLRRIRVRRLGRFDRRPQPRQQPRPIDGMEAVIAEGALFSKGGIPVRLPVKCFELGAVPYVQPVLKTEIDKRNRDYRERQ